MKQKLESDHKLRVAYAGIDLLSNVPDALLQAGCEIIRIFTCKTDNRTEFNTEIKAFAAQHHIPCTERRITREDIADLKQAGCRLFICGGYYYKIPVDASFPMVNIHPTRLPEGRGPWPMPIAILKGMTEGGVTIHKLTEQFDCGDILLQETFPMAADETLVSYMEKARALLPAMIERLADGVDRLWKTALPQGEGEYWPEPGPEVYTVDSRMTVAKADRILRAFLGYECYYREYSGGQTRLWEIIGGRAFPFQNGGDVPKNSLPLRDGWILAEQLRRIETGKAVEDHADKGN